MIRPVRTDGMSVMIEETMMHASTAASCFQYGFRYENTRRSSSFVTFGWLAFSSSVRKRPPGPPILPPGPAMMSSFRGNAALL